MRFISIITIILLVISTSSCDRSTVQFSPVKNFDRDYFLSAANEVEITSTSVIFTDAAHDEPIEIMKNPKRVACLFPSFTTLWYEAGGTVVGCIGGTSSELYLETIGRDIASDPQMTVIGRTPAAKSWDIETLMALDCDLIICSRSMNGYSTIADIAKSAQIPLICAKYDTFTDYLKWFKVFSNITNNSHLWEQIALPTLDVVLSLLNDLPAATVIVLPIFAGTTSVKACTSSTMLGEMLVQLDAINVADSPNSPGDLIDISLESVLIADPDVILVQCHASTELAKAQIDASFADNPVWNTLDAVKNGRVVYLDKSLFHNKPNSRFDEAYVELANILYSFSITD